MPSPREAKGILDVTEEDVKVTDVEIKWRSRVATRSTIREYILFKLVQTRAVRAKIAFWVYRLVIAWGCISISIIGPIMCYVISAYSGPLPQEFPNTVDKLEASLYAIGWFLAAVLLLIWSARSSEEMKGYIYWTFQIPLIVNCVQWITRKRNP